MQQTSKTFRRFYRRGHTRSHPELGSQALRSRWYCTGNLCGRVGNRRANLVSQKRVEREPQKGPLDATKPRAPRNTSGPVFVLFVFSLRARGGNPMPEEIPGC
jgi:hypothetical protein